MKPVKLTLYYVLYISGADYPEARMLNNRLYPDEQSARNARDRSMSPDLKTSLCSTTITVGEVLSLQVLPECE